MKDNTHVMPVLDTSQIAFGTQSVEIASRDVIMICPSVPLLRERQFMKFADHVRMMPELLQRSHLHRLVHVQVKTVYILPSLTFEVVKELHDAVVAFENIYLVCVFFLGVLRVPHLHCADVTWSVEMCFGVDLALDIRIYNIEQAQISSFGDI